MITNRSVLRTTTNERVHNAVVPHLVQQLPSEGRRHEGLGPNFPSGERGFVEDGFGYLGSPFFVSFTFVYLCVSLYYHPHHHGPCHYYCSHYHFVISVLMVLIKGC